MEDAIELVTRRMGRWGVRVGKTFVEGHPVRGRLHGLGRTYVRLVSETGFEDDVVRAMNVAAWRSGLPRGRLGVLVVRSPLILPASGSGRPGPIEFTDAYQQAKAAVGAANVSATGVKILVVDVDRPATKYLPAGADVTVIDPSQRAIEDGHATLVTAVVADIAQGATITTLSVSDEHSSGFWALMDVFLNEQDADVIVASIWAPEGGSSKDGRGRDNSFESSLRDRRHLPSRPPMLFPTGNHDPTDSTATLHTMAIPAWFESVIAIGAADEHGRSAGSRYGSKKGDDPSAWWLAPGGSFDGTSIQKPLVRMGGQGHAGTSIATAIAGGLAAVAIQKLLRQQPVSDPVFDEAMAVVRARLQMQASAETSLVLADTLKATHAGHAITLDRLVAEFDQMSRPERIPNHNTLENGRGLLCLQ
jgi:hypothetical protein